MLAANESKTTRERLTLIRLYEELRGLGYAGGYDVVRRYARRWSRERGASTSSAYVPLSFAPGEAYQFDWSHEVVLLSGTTVVVKAAHVRLCHSRMLFVRAYPRETQEISAPAAAPRAPCRVRCQANAAPGPVSAIAGWVPPRSARRVTSANLRDFQRYLVRRDWPDRLQANFLTDNP